VLPSINGSSAPLDVHVRSSVMLVAKMRWPLADPGDVIAELA